MSGPNRTCAYSILQNTDSPFSLNQLAIYHPGSAHHATPSSPCSPSSRSPTFTPKKFEFTATAVQSKFSIVPNTLVMNTIAYPYPEAAASDMNPNAVLEYVHREQPTQILRLAFSFVEQPYNKADAHGALRFDASFKIVMTKEDVTVQ